MILLYGPGAGSSGITKTLVTTMRSARGIMDRPHVIHLASTILAVKVFVLTRILASTSTTLATSYSAHLADHERLLTIVPGRRRRQRQHIDDG